MARLKNLQFFSAHEFPDREEEVQWADQMLFVKMDELRRKLDAPIIPSPVPGALTRFAGSTTSRHYSDRKEKFSTAIDVFISEQNPLEHNFTNTYRAYTLALNLGFGGIGVYLDTFYDDLTWPMLHLDIRPHTSPVLWIREGKEIYMYPHLSAKNRAHYFESLITAFKPV